MNYIDVTQNRHTHCIKHNVVTVISKEGIQGPAGKDGAIPYIDKETGHWCVNGIDTGVLAVGVPGKTPYIDENNYWNIGDTNTGIKATGIDGISPHIGENGHWFVGDYDTFVSAKAQDGISPHIGENGHWFVGTVDTGVEAGLKEDDITRFHRYTNLYEFPLVGKSKDLYIDETNNIQYRYDPMTASYKSFSPDYKNDMPKIIDAMNESNLVIFCGDSEIVN